jgi:excisionase family DNA binding protein
MATGYKKRYLQQLVQEGKLPHYKPPGRATHISFLLSEVNEWMQSSRRGPGRPRKYQAPNGQTSEQDNSNTNNK